MTPAAICVTREVSWQLSFYRGEQYDSDLGLYYLRARYYNPATGRFLSRVPEDGKATIFRRHCRVPQPLVSNWVRGVGSVQARKSPPRAAVLPPTAR